LVKDLQSQGSGSSVASATTTLKNDGSIHYDQNAIDANLKSLLEFKKSLLEGQKDGEKKIENLNESIETTKKQIDQERVKLDELRTKLKSVNEIKDAEYPRFVELKESIIKARNEIKSIDEKTGQVKLHRSDLSNLSKALSQVEKDIQTKKLSKDEERKLVARSKELATRLHALKLIHKKEDKYRDISSQYDTVKVKMNEIFEKRTEFGKKIGDLKNKLDKLLNSRENLYEERRRIIREVRETAAKLEMVDTQINAIEFRKSRTGSSTFKRRRNIESPVNKFELVRERAKRSKENQQIWNSMREEAVKKMSTGEKLTFDEMKLIYGDLSTVD